MKRVAALILAMILILMCVPAFAEDVFDRFQPYTDVDLSAFKSAGYTSSYDEFNFTAELYPANSSITFEGTYDTYTIKFDLKLIYSAGECLVVPRMIFTRSGMLTYYDSSMDVVHIKNGENRYQVDVSGCSRSSSSKSSTATDSSVQPIRLKGLVMLKDLADSSETITMIFNNYTLDIITLTDSDKAIIKSFYDTCLAAGVFDQDGLYDYTDNYYVITLFNEGSTGTEDVISEEESEEETEPTDAE